MKKKMRNVVFAMLAIVCIVVSNLNLMTVYALEGDDTSEGDDIRTFHFDVTYEGVRIEGTTIEVFEMDFDSTGTNEEKYKKLAEGTTVVSCAINLSQLERDNNILYVRYDLPSPYEFRYVETDENGEATDIPSDYELYWLVDLVDFADGAIISNTNVVIGTTPEEPAEPENPTVPEVPSTPETPTVPEVPSTPEIPTVPEVPSVPETPTVPSTPDSSENTTTTTNRVDAVSAFLNNTESENVTVRNDASTGTQVEEAVLKDIFQTLKETEKEVTFSFEDAEGNESYSWTFDGSEITNPDAHILDFKVESNADVEEVTDAIVATGIETESETVHFAHEGELPGTATVKAKVNLPDQKVYFYYYNPVTRFLELVSDQVMIQNGYATFQIEHCSDYVLSTKELTKTDTIKPATENKTEPTVSTPATETSVVATAAAMTDVATQTAPKTADASADAYFAIFCLMAGAGILVIGSKKIICNR